MTAFVFFVAAALTLAGALGVIACRNPVHSALCLVVTLVSVAVLFLQLDADFLVAVQIIVYAGAIVVLFLFVIMLLGVDRSESMTEPLALQRPVAVALGALLLAETLLLAGNHWATGSRSDAGHSVTHGNLGNNVERVARSLFTDYLWPFELTALLLVLAVVGSVALARRSGAASSDEGAAG